METRRLYITSADSKPKVLFNKKVVINLAKGHLECQSNQLLGLSIVRATLPATLEAVPATIGKGLVGNNTDISKLSISAIVGGTAVSKEIYFNDFFNINTTVVPAGSYSNMTWTIGSTPNNIIHAINLALGGPMLEISNIESSNRVEFASTTAGDSVIFNYVNSSTNILKALGLNPDADTLLNSTNLYAPFFLDFANLLPVVFVRTNVGVSGFMSRNGGTTENILGSIPITVSNLNAGNNVIAFSNATQNESYQPSAAVNYINHAIVGGHKIISNQHINSMELELINQNGVVVGTGLNDYSLTLELKTYD